MAIAISSNCDNKNLDMKMAMLFLKWHRFDESYPYEPSSNGICRRIVWKDASNKVMATSDEFLPNFSGDANVILPLLEKYNIGDIMWINKGWSIVIDGHAHSEIDGKHTFCRAACFALLRSIGIRFL